MRSLLPLSLLAFAACAPRAAVVTTTSPAPSVGAEMPTAVHWTRNSAEHRAVLLQIYRGAGEQMARLASGRAAGSWAVILDADETVIDNSTYQKERAEVGGGYSDSTWNAWVRRRSATALPGAAEFIRRVRSLGGKAVIVTNRQEIVCEDTRANFRALSIDIDAMYCRPQGASSDKNPRFQAVQNGTAAGLPKLDVVMWVGDNILDFPALAQSIRTSDAPFAEFGQRFIVIPNPMYGSWESNEKR
jgi:5'-nucleotidase (lipoprotein e(P4) family)